MRTEESQLRFLTRLAGNLFNVLPWFLALFATCTILPFLRPMAPAMIEIFLPLTLLGALAWTFADVHFTAEPRLRDLLGKRLYEQAFRVAAQNRQLELLEQLLNSSLTLPSEQLRPKIRAVFSELRILHERLHDPSNRYIEPTLRRAMRERCEEARLALWKLCENLEVVASQKVRFANDHPKMRRISSVLSDLTQSTGEVRVKLAELTLAPQQVELEEARIAIDQVRRQSEALLEWESLAE